MTDLLAKAPARYQIFQALRILEARLGVEQRLGTRGSAAAERIRLRPSTSLGFPVGELVEVETRERPDGTLDAEVTTNLPGLYGVGSSLPRWIPHEILLSEDEKPQLRSFLDHFTHHRLLSLWYRTYWQFHYEHSFRPDGQDLLSRALLDWLGVPPGATAESLGVEPVVLLRYLGLLVQRTRPVAGLEILLQDLLAIPLRIEQLPPRWVTLPKDQWCRLATAAGRRVALGRDIVIGASRFERLGALRLHIGPVNFVTLCALWPGGALLQRLERLSRFYLRPALDLSLHIRVPRSELPALRMSRSAPMRLGAPQTLGPCAADPVVFYVETSLGTQVARRAGLLSFPPETSASGEEDVPCQLPRPPATTEPALHPCAGGGG